MDRSNKALQNFKQINTKSPNHVLAFFMLTPQSPFDDNQNGKAGFA
jgi:hypothetical protein